MKRHSSPPVRPPRLTPLALCLGLAFAIGPADARQHALEPADTRRSATHASIGNHADSLVERYPAGHPFHPPLMAALQREPPDRPAGAQIVSSCDDAGPGSLRQAVDSAVSGDVVDLSALECSGISLASGALLTAVDDLTIVGPEEGIFLLAGPESQVIVHLGSGVLQLQNLGVAYGHKYVEDGAASGGCVFSSGSVALLDASAKYCRAETAGNHDARGGGVFATRDVMMNRALVAANWALAESGSGGEGFGGGVFSGEDAFILNSTLAVNEASGSGGSLFTEGGLATKYSSFRDSEATTGTGGGIAARGGNVTITNSTVSGNTASHAGGIDMSSADPGHAASITNSTIAFNEGTDTRFGGAIYSGLDLELESCTISGNIERHDQPEKYGGGLSMRDGVVLQMRNTIVSGNQRFTIGGDAGVESDIRAFGPSALVVTGAGNLVDAAFNTTVPADTLDAQPALGPLAANGGATLTMAPLEGSPALDAGVSSELESDQRGTSFVRQVGPAVDIGAFEAGQVLFADGFEE